MNKYISMISALFIAVSLTSVCSASDDELALQPVAKKSCVAEYDVEASISKAREFPKCAIQRDPFRKVLAQSDILVLGRIAMANKAFAAEVERELKKRCQQQWGIATLPPMFEKMMTPWLSCYANELYFRELLTLNIKGGHVDLILPSDEQKRLLGAFVKYYRQKAPSISTHIELGGSSLMDERGEDLFWAQWGDRSRELEQLNGFSLRHEFCLARDCCRDRDNIWWFSSELEDWERPVFGAYHATYAYLVSGIRATHGSLQCIVPQLQDLYIVDCDVPSILRVIYHPLLGPKFSRNFLDSVADEFMAHIPVGTRSHQESEGLYEFGEAPNDAEDS